jgi:type IV fimbrial biogenesis protein FimT
MRKRAKLHTQRGFTLVELMVTIAVVAILAAVAVPGLQAFVARSGMNGVRDDFAIALQRARLDAINRNTCVSVCQLAAAGGTQCATGAAVGQWHQGWVTYVDAACSGALTAADVISVRQPGNARYTLQVGNGGAVGVMTFDPRGALVAGVATFEVRDARDRNSPHGRDITVSRQGRVQVGPAPATTSTAGSTSPPAVAANTSP